MTPRTLFQKIWDSHVVSTLGDGTVLLYIDRHLINEVTSPQAFEGLRSAKRGVRRPANAIAVADHNVPTNRRAEGVLGIQEADSRLQVETLERNVASFGIPYIPLTSRQQGIVHIIGPEFGLTLPGATIVCGDSHTSTHGAFGALAFGIGTSEVEHVLATQTLQQSQPKTCWSASKARSRPAAPRKTSSSRSSAKLARPAAPAMSSNMPAKRCAHSTWPAA
jgi:3-isopropylmalate/(R)-2-methylmalate dehydratase large subunit